MVSKNSAALTKIIKEKVFSLDNQTSSCNLVVGIHFQVFLNDNPCSCNYDLIRDKS